MLTYFPAIRPYAKHHIQVTSKHQIYVEESGEPNGLPLVVVHGGPGKGSIEDLRRFADPTVYRIILFDQRGCGHSTPHAELHENHLQALVDDIEKICFNLKLSKLILLGEGFGSTVCLRYAQQFTDNVKALVLQGIFLNREHDIDWYFGHTAKHIFPEFWRNYTEHFSVEEQQHLPQAFYKRLHGADELARMSTAKAWALWQARCATLDPHPHLVEKLIEPTTALPWAIVASHFLHNQFFLETGQILNEMTKIKHLPGIIIHGRYDMLMPVENAWMLQNVWPNSQLHIIRDAGHAISEAGTIDAIIRALMDLAERYTAA